MKDNKKSKGFSHFILTRFNNGVYEREDAAEWMKNRLELFKVTRESVLSQKGEFKWILSFDERTPDEVIDECITDDRMVATCTDIRDFDFYVDTPFVITTRIDNDDLLLNGAVKAIQDAFVPQLAIIDIRYYQFNQLTGDRYTNGNEAKKEMYRTSEHSPFMSLIEPSDYIKTVLCRPHQYLKDGYPAAKGFIQIRAYKLIEKEYAIQVIHSSNIINKITGYKL